jgi:hypothetical protein
LRKSTRGVTKEFPRNSLSILNPGEFPFLWDSRGIPIEEYEIERMQLQNLIPSGE